MSTVIPGSKLPACQWLRK